MILRIAGTPARSYYQHASDRPHLVAAEASHQMLESIGPLRSSGAGEIANVTCILRAKALSTMASLPPIGATATLSNAGVEIVSGTVVSLAWSPDGLSVEVRP